MKFYSEYAKSSALRTVVRLDEEVETLNFEVLREEHLAQLKLAGWGRKRRRRKAASAKTPK